MKKSLMMVFFGTFLLLSCILLGDSVIDAGAAFNGICGMNKAVIELKEGTASQSVNPFLLSDFNKLADELETDGIAYVVWPESRNTQVTHGNSSCMAAVKGTGHKFPEFTYMSMVSGSFFNRVSEEESSRVAVIDEELAWILFKSSDVVGKTIEIYGIPIKITGVFRKDASILGVLAEDGYPEVILPGKLLMELDTASKIKSIEVRAKYENTLDSNRAWISEGLQGIGRDSSIFRITDFNIQNALLRQKPRLIVFIPGFIAILILFSYMTGVVKGAVILIRRECGSDYLSCVLRREAASLGKSVFKVLAAALAVAFLWDSIRFRLYIPPALIPEELINISHFAGLVKDSFRVGIDSGMLTQESSLLYLRIINQLTGGFYAVLAVCGVLLIFTGQAWARRQGVDVYKAVLACGVSIVISCLLAFGILYAAKLSPVFDTKSIAILWVSVFLQTLYFARRGNSVGIENLL